MIILTMLNVFIIFILFYFDYYYFLSLRYVAGKKRYSLPNEAFDPEKTMMLGAAGDLVCSPVCSIIVTKCCYHRN